MKKVSGYRRLLLPILIALSLAAALAACWIIPYRLRHDPGHSEYTFGYIGDEYVYADRISPLLPDCSGANPTNAFGDRDVVSQLYLERILRGTITLTGIDVIDVAWVWRWLFCPVLLLMLWPLCRACIGRRLRPWSGDLIGSAWVAAFPLLYCLYDLVTKFPPFQGMLNRFVSNTEYLLSLGLAWAYIRFVRAPDSARGIVLAAVSAATLYLRPYGTLPWGLTVVIGVLYMLAARRLPLRTALVTFCALLVFLAPWMAINQWNKGTLGYQDFMSRYSRLTGYQVHERWRVFLSAGVFLAAAGWYARRLRLLLWPAALTLLVVPFVTALVPVVAKEITFFDRYGLFYLPLILLALVAVLGEHSLGWHGRRGLSLARRWSSGLCCLSLAASSVLAWRNLHYDFHQYPKGPLPFIAADQASLPAYRWIRDYTPPDALFLVDDGVDYSVDMRTINMSSHADLFQMVARRQRVYNWVLFTNFLREGTLTSLYTLHVDTFGARENLTLYPEALRVFAPRYVLWRRKFPFPRGPGTVLLKFRSSVVYSDAACEIWKLDYPAEELDFWKSIAQSDVPEIRRHALKTIEREEARRAGKE